MHLLYFRDLLRAILGETPPLLGGSRFSGYVPSEDLFQVKAESGIVMLSGNPTHLLL